MARQEVLALVAVLLLAAVLTAVQGFGLSSSMRGVSTGRLTQQAHSRLLHKESVSATSLSMSLDKGPGGKEKGPPKKKLKDDVVQVDGRVVESLPNAMFRVEIQPSKQVVLATISGKIRKNFVRILVGDSVVCELSAYDLTKGRITYRSKGDTGPRPT